MNQKVLQRAILMPEDVLFDSKEKTYPDPAYGLMDNPFPKKKPKKKKRRRRRRAKTTLREYVR